LAEYIAPGLYYNQQVPGLGDVFATTPSLSRGERLTLREGQQLADLTGIRPPNGGDVARANLACRDQIRP